MTDSKSLIDKFYKMTNGSISDRWRLIGMFVPLLVIVAIFMIIAI